ncbi:MAG: hypothetical protein DMG06_00735 [Acidobacteria bacterium]|nr:MAG: hypothetical protein DMG06_00735 [Acidobacteriota bacterium]
MNWTNGWRKLSATPLSSPVRCKHKTSLPDKKNGEVLVPPKVLTDLKSYLSVDSFRALIT